MSWYTSSVLFAVSDPYNWLSLDSHTRFWTGEVAAVRRMHAHVGSQSSETGEVHTHIRVYYVIYNEMFTYLTLFGT
jgi:hypothetical protein